MKLLDRIRGAGHKGGVVETVSASALPGPREVAEAVEKLGAERCYLMPDRQPLDELWIPDLGLWLNMKNLTYAGDRGRGSYCPGVIGKWFLARAVENWKRENKE